MSPEPSSPTSTPFSGEVHDRPSRAEAPRPYKLQDLIDIEQCQILQDRLNEIYRFTSAILDNEGHVLTATAWQDICTRFHRKHPECERECIKSDRYIFSHFHEADPAVTYICPHGLVDNAAPIVIDGIHYGNFFTGQFLLDKPDLEFFRAQARKFGFEEQAYLAAVAKVPIWSQEKLKSYLFFIKGLVAILSEGGLKKLREIEAQKRVQETEQRALTDRKRAEEALRESEETFSRAFHAGPLLMAISDLETGRYLEVNEPCLALTGYSRDEIVGRTADEVGWTAPEDRKRRRQLLQRDGRVINYELTLRKKNGEPLYCLYHATIITTKGRQRVMSISQDITQRKQAEEERERLQAQLTQAQKMEFIGRLAGGVAHDFNNMLQAILGNVDLALQDLPPGNPLRENLEEIEKCAQRSADLTQQLLAFARKQTVAPRVLDLNSTVEGMLKMLRRLMGENIDLAWRPAASLWPVQVDPSQVDQVLANLCVNARDAIHGVGKVTLETRNVSSNGSNTAPRPGFVPGDYVLLAVTDTGCGMDREVLGHLFEPFFTTKGQGQGTGLGLATVYGIVQQNHGFINVSSEPAHGTTFEIYLPRHTDRAEAAHQETPAPVIAHGRETLLLVEDEPAILRVAQRTLEGFGYTVLTASSPAKAIALAQEYPGQIHLLMTDVIMPEMNGRELAKRLLSLHPRLKCLFMSGYTADVIAHHGVLAEGIHFLQKPFTTKTLAQRVHAALQAQ